MTISAFLSRYFYLEGITCLTILAGMTVSLIRFNRHKELNIFTLYFLLCVLQGFTAIYIHTATSGKALATMIFGVYSNFFMVAEYSIFTYFLYNSISSIRRKWAIKANAGVFFLILLFAWIRKPRFEYSPALFSLESIFLILPCLVYFYELFIDLHMEPLKEQPPFWVNTGILFLNACSIPLFVSVTLIHEYFKIAFSLNYILYTIFYLLVIRAYLCKPGFQVSSGVMQV